MGLTSLKIDSGVVLLRDVLNSELAFDKKCILTVEILEQIQLLEENGFTVEPVKTTNVLITPDGQARLFDFGMP